MVGMYVRFLRNCMAASVKSKDKGLDYLKPVCRNMNSLPKGKGWISNQKWIKNCATHPYNTKGLVLNNLILNRRWVEAGKREG